VLVFPGWQMRSKKRPNNSFNRTSSSGPHPHLPPVNSTVSRHNLPHMASLSCFSSKSALVGSAQTICRSATPCCPGSSQRSHPHCSQAPGRRVHETGVPFNDPSGDRLRSWMGISHEIFYDPNASQSSLWAFASQERASRRSAPVPSVPSVARGHSVTSEEPSTHSRHWSYAQAYHLPSETQSVTAVVQAWRETASHAIALPIQPTQ